MLERFSIVAFVATSRHELAREFYGDRLGLTLVEETPYALVFRAGTTMLRIQRVEEFEPHPFTTLGWDVPDIRSTVAELADRDVNVERFSFIEQDASGIWWTPNGDGVAWFKDPDGNTLSLTQFANS